MKYKNEEIKIIHNIIGDVYFYYVKDRVYLHLEDAKSFIDKGF